MTSLDHEIYVIGYGIAGRTAAYRLLQSGFKVKIIESSFEDCSASFAAQGLSSIKGLVFSRSNLFDMKMRGHNSLLRLLEDLQKLSETPIFEVSSVFEPYSDENEKEKITQRVYGHQFYSLYHRNQIDLTKSFRMPCREQFKGAWQYPRDFIYDAEKVMELLDSEIRRRGAGFVKGHVEQIYRFDEDRLEVFTEGECYMARDVILCGGVSTQKILRKSRLPFHKTRHIAGATLRGESSSWANYKNSGWISGKNSAVVLGNRVFLGSTSESLFDKTKEEVVHEARPILLQLVKDLFHQNVQELASSTTTKFGIRACYENMVPQVEPICLENNHSKMWVVSGLYKNGYQIAPYAAELISSDLLQKYDG